MQKTISTEQTPANITAALDILRQIPPRLAELSAGLSTEQLQTPLGEGERSFTENMAHLINCEARSAETIYAALVLNEPLMLTIHAERDWGKLLRHDAWPLADLLTYFTFRRGVMLRVLEGLTDQQWGRVVRQEGKQRKESVYWQVRGLAMHEQEHVADLAGKLPLVK